MFKRAYTDAHDGVTSDILLWVPPPRETQSELVQDVWMTHSGHGEVLAPIERSVTVGEGDNFSVSYRRGSGERVTYHFDAAGHVTYLDDGHFRYMPGTDKVYQIDASSLAPMETPPETKNALPSWQPKPSSYMRVSYSGKQMAGDFGNQLGTLPPSVELLGNQLYAHMDFVNSFEDLVGLS